MKQLLFSLATLAVMGCTYKAHAQVKLGATAGAPDGSAILEMESTSKGFLPPRMTSAQRDAIVNPAKGLIIYNTTLDCMETNVGTSSVPQWKCMTLGVANNTAGILSEVLEGSASAGGASNANGIMVTAAQLTNLGITGVVSANEAAYNAAILAATTFSNPPTTSEIQSMVNSVNSNVTSILAQIGNEGDNPDVVNSVVTAAQLTEIGITGVTPGNEDAYQQYIDSHPDQFSNPASLSELQTMVTSVNNTVTGVLAQIGNEGDNPDVVNSVVTAAQLTSVGITGVTPGNEGAYQDYIDSHPDQFSNPASVSEIQAMVTSVNNTVTGVLAQIGNEADNPDVVNSVVTAAQLTSVGITGVTPDNEGAYQDYIDSHPDQFSNPASLSELQTMVTSVNNTVTGVLAQIGNEGDNPDVVNSVVTAAQLQSVGITGVTPDNEGAYQDYIDSHPDQFSNPATLSELQTMVTSVNNTVTGVLAQIGNEGDNPDVVNSVVTAAQLTSVGITGVTPDNEGAYQDYIDSHPDQFSNPATLSELQTMVTSVNNTVTSVLAQIGNEGDNPDVVNSVVTAAQLQSVGITGVTPDNEGAYQDYIDSHPDQFSNPATISELQTMVTSVNNTVTSVLAQIGNEGDNPDVVNSVVTAAQLTSVGITGVTPDNEGAYQDYIDSHPDQFSNPATISELQTMVTSVNNTVTSVLAQIGNEGDNPDVVNSVVTAAQLTSVGITGVTPGYEVAYQDYIDSHPDQFSNPATLSEIQTMITAVNASAATSGGTATVSSFTCTTASAGTLTVGQSASGVTQTITASVTTAGTYNITATANGVTFSGSGTFAGTGNQDILLTASGTPTAAGSDNYTLSTTPNCSFSRTATNVSSGGTSDVTSWSCGGALTGVAVQGVAVSGLTKDITVDVTTPGSYSISATANGITFSGSGTFSGTGSQNITLTASGTPTAAGTHSFTINSTPSCSFNVTTKTLSKVDYIVVGRSASLQTLSLGSDVILDVNNGGNIPYNTSTGVFTLTAGKTYRMTFNGYLHSFSDFIGLYNIEWVDATSNTPLVANVKASYQMQNSDGPHDHKPTADIIYTPSTTQTVKLRVTTAGPTGITASLAGTSNGALIQELGVVNAGDSLATVDYVMARQTVGGLSIANGATDIKLDVKESGNIPYNTSTGAFSLTAGKTYHLLFEGRFIGFADANGYVDVFWVDATTNASLAGINAHSFPVSLNTQNTSTSSVEFIYTPATNQSIKLRASSNTTSTLHESSAIIYQLGSNSSLATVGYNTSNATGAVNIPSGVVTTTMVMNNTVNGNMTHNTTTGTYTLEAGKTYRLTFIGEFNNFSNATSGYVSSGWVDGITGGYLQSSMNATIVPVTYNATASRNGNVTTIYTPTVNQTVKVAVTYSQGGTATLSTGTSDRVIIEELGVKTN